jgi:hypothetical protein
MNVRAKSIQCRRMIIGSREKESRIPLEDKESTMIEPMTEEEEARVLAEAVARARRVKPRIERVAPPIDWDEFLASGPGPFYEGFEEDLRRMRRGLEPLGPRE